MSKPSWESAPDWANWLAMDSNGVWFWYENEPHIEDKTRFLAEGKCLEVPAYADGWQNSVEKRPAVSSSESISVIREADELSF